MSFEAIKKQEQEYILHSYGRVAVALSHGKNAEAWDVEGKHYYDFTSGIGVNALGYCDEGWVKAVTEQAGKIQHMSKHTACGTACKKQRPLPFVLLQQRRGSERVRH